MTCGGVMRVVGWDCGVWWCGAVVRRCGGAGHCGVVLRWSGFLYTLSEKNNSDVLQSKINFC